MIPWLLLIENISTSGTKLAELVKERIDKYPVSGEINRKVEDPRKLIEDIKNFYLDTNAEINDLDGYSFDFSNWRFNLRMSNTEPLVRLNVETRGDYQLMTEKTKEILDLIEKLS
jgi:phosphomannomutase/phosphomannomutase/phosphoglucomutase